MFELLEQSVVHEELDKIRRDLNEFAYKTKDASHILNLPFLNPEASSSKKPGDIFANLPDMKPKPSLTTKEVQTSNSVRGGGEEEDSVKAQ